MIVKPSVTELLTKANNRYELVIATSRRARQIAAGDEPMTKVKEESPVTLAANEIAEGKVEIERENEIVEEEETEEITEENEFYEAFERALLFIHKKTKSKIKIIRGKTKNRDKLKI